MLRRRQPPGLGVVVAVERARPAPRARSWSSARTTYCSPEVQVDRALVHGRVGARLVDQARAACRCRPRSRRRRSATAERSEILAAGMVGALGRPARPGRPRCRAASAPASSAGLAEVARRRPASAAARLRRTAGGRPAPPGCRGSRRPPRPAGRAAPAGWRARYWSSWSSPATSSPRPAPAAAGAAPLLAQRRHGAGEADRDRAVEHADVDAQLERAGGDHAEQARRRPARVRSSRRCSGV